MNTITALFSDDSKVSIRVVTMNTVVTPFKYMFVIAVLLGDDSTVTMML